MAHHVIDGIHHFFPGKIQDKLVSSMAAGAAGNFQDPVRMRPIQIGILVDHFRFKPETHFHAQSADAF